MKLHILSDLHLEYGAFQPPPTDADVVVLAGDIHMRDQGISWALDCFSVPVLYVMGNHEAYGSSIAATMADLRARARGSRVHVLQEDALVLDGVRFLGATLWTDYRLTGNQPLAQIDAMQRISDFKRVEDASPDQYLEWHVQSRAFLERSLDAPFDGPTVVVTHHAPCELSVSDRYRDGHMSASYASRLDGLMGSAALWAHGHTHDSFDYEIYGTRVVCNPRGYQTERLNPRFNPGLVLEV